MRVLLDTHIILPLIDEQADTSERSIRDILRDPNLLFASVACLRKMT